MNEKDSLSEDFGFNRNFRNWGNTFSHHRKLPTTHRRRSFTLTPAPLPNKPKRVGEAPPQPNTQTHIETQVVVER